MLVPNPLPKRRHNIFTRSKTAGTMTQKKSRRTFEPIENVTDKDVERIIHEALVRNFRVYDRLAEI